MFIPYHSNNKNDVIYSLLASSQLEAEAPNGVFSVK